MLYFHGDIHGNPIKYFSFKKHPEMRQLTTSDTMIVLGDCGVPWNDATINEDIYTLNWLNGQVYKFIFIMGNHDNYDLVEQMPQIEFCGGVARQCVYQGKVYKNIVYIDTPTILNLESKTCFIIPGAHSHDIADGIIDGNDPNWTQLWKTAMSLNKQMRVSHVTWWEQEAIKIDIIKNILDNGLDKVDLILSHQAPAYQTSFLPNDEQIFLAELSKKIEYKMWLHGHLHKWLDNYYHNTLGIYEQTLSYDDVINMYYKNQERMGEYVQ